MTEAAIRGHQCGQGAADNCQSSMLWVNLTRGSSPGPEFQDFANYFSIVLLQADDIRMQQDERPGYSAILFEYDYPDRAGLENLRQTKQLIPGVPILMLTEQHSESLAVWALRTQVLDYLVKPLTTDYIARLASKLAEISKLRERNREARRPFNHEESIPYEIRISAYIATANSVKRAANYIDTHLKEKIYCGKLAALCGMNEKEFSLAFKKAYAMTFSRYHTERRIEKASQLLRHPEANIVDIAFTIGFRDASYFSRTFKNIVGCTPSEYSAITRKQDIQPISIPLSEPPRQISLMAS